MVRIRASISAQPDARLQHREVRSNQVSRPPLADRITPA